MRNGAFIGLFLWMLLGAGGFAVAGHPLVTEDAATQGKGHAEVDFTLDRRHDGNGTKTTSPGNAITLGIAPRSDLALSYSYDFARAADGTKSRGMGPVEATLKTVLLDGKGRVPALGVKAGVSLPASEGDHTAVLLTGVAYWWIEPVAVLVNAGADVGTRLAGNDRRTTTLRASLAGIRAFRNEWYLLSELLVGKPSSPPAPTSAEWLIGGKKEFTDTVSVDAGIRWGLTANSPHVTYLVGCTLGFRGGHPEPEGRGDPPAR